MVDAKTLYPTTPVRRPADTGPGEYDERTGPLDLAVRGFRDDRAGAALSLAGMAGEDAGVSEAPGRGAGAAAEETVRPAAAETSLEPAGETAELTPEQRTALFYTAPDGPVATAGQVALGLSGFFDGLQANLSDAPERHAQAAEAERALPAALSEAGLAAADLRELTGLIDGYLGESGEAGERQGQAEERDKRQARDYARAEAKLRETFGPRAGPLLADARAAVALVERRSPGFKAWLDATGAGNDPRILRAAIRAGRRLRREGRL